MGVSLDNLRGAGAVFVDVDFADLTKAALAVRAVLGPEGFRVDLAEFLAHEYPAMSMKDVYAGIASRSVRTREEDARDHPPSGEDVQKARAAMEEVGAQYKDAFRRYNVVAIAYPPVPFSAPPLPAAGNDVSAFEFGGQQFALAVIRNAVVGPVYRAPGLSIPAGLTSDGLPAGFEIDGLPGDDNQLLRLCMAIEAVLGPLPPPTFRNG